LKGNCVLRTQFSLFFERACEVSFQIKYIIHKKIYQPLGPQNTPLYSSDFFDDTKFLTICELIKRL